VQAASAPGTAEAECKGATDNTIFNHIRKKSKDFPTLMLSKSMDSSYEPRILKNVMCMAACRGAPKAAHGLAQPEEAGG